MNASIENANENAKRRGLLLMILGGVLLTIVIAIGSALAAHPPRSGFSSGPGLSVVVFGVFSSAIGTVALLGGSWQLRTGRVSMSTRYAILGLGVGLIVAILQLV